MRVSVCLPFVIRFARGQRYASVLIPVIFTISPSPRPPSRVAGAMHCAR
jgi:hypothetical protein